jgi:hypothetical protein
VLDLHCVINPRLSSVSSLVLLLFKQGGPGSQGRTTSTRRDEDVFEGRAAIGYDYGCEAQKFYLDLALALKYVED